MSDKIQAQLEELEAKKATQQAAVDATNAKIAEVRKAARGDVLAAMRNDIKNYEFAPHELFDSLSKPTPVKQKPGKALSGKAKTIVFADKDGNTWGGGKGPRPQWVKAIQEAGGDMEQYRTAPKASV